MELRKSVREWRLVQVFVLSSILCIILVGILKKDVFTLTALAFGVWLGSSLLEFRNPFKAGMVRGLTAVTGVVVCNFIIQLL